jgi:uncharacterized membrane protein
MSVDGSADPPRRQVLPDVDEGAEFFGQSIFGLMQLYMPAFAIWFGAQHFAPPGFGWIGILLGLLLAITATAAVLASPSHQSPGEYARTVWTQYTKQGVRIHE